MSTIEDYQAAELLLRRPARPGELVIGDKVRPQWVDGGARFWYGVSTGVGRRFVLVDPAAGSREPAFDHARLAAALADASGQQVDPEGLPFMAIALAGNAVEFDVFGEHWRCRLDSYACERAEFTPPGNPLEVPSPDMKGAGSRRGHDLWARSLAEGREWALTSDGEPAYQYGSGPDCTSNGTLLRKFGLPHLPPAVAWSPDSTRVLTHRTDERGVRQAHLVEAMPDFFVEVPVELARKKGIANADMVRVRSKRGEVEGLALVTKRMRPLRLGSKVVYQVGIPVHWHYAAGHSKGKGAQMANLLTPYIGDATTATPEFKGFLVDIERA
jgi:anaerobic selenocysteine-containing dehydrogenase